MDKMHYWIVNSKVWNGRHYDEFSSEFSTILKYINKDILKQIKQSLSIEKGYHPEQYVIVSVSYLGEMTKDEWEGNV